MEITMNEDLINQKMKELAERIGYEFNDLSHLKKAMYCQIIHKPEDGKNRKNYTNDSYATLGDAVLKLILTENFFDKNYDKGKITLKKQELEKNKSLYDICEKYNIFTYAYNDDNFFNQAPKHNKVPHPKHDIYVEAIIAAIYKDKGIDYCKKWVGLIITV